MTLWIIWLSLAALLMIIEVFSQMVWTLCLAIGCVAALVGDCFGVALEWQLIILAATTVAAYIILVPYVKRWHEKQVAKEGRASRTGMEALLGRRAVVTQVIHPGEIGRARIDGDSWQVVAPGVPYAIPCGAEVIVTDYNSIILTATLPDK